MRRTFGPSVPALCGLSRAALALIPALACSACGHGPQSIGHVDSVIADDGSLHILTQVREGAEEGQSFVARQFLYARPSGGQYEILASAADLDGDSREEEAAYQLVFDGTGRAIIATQTSQGVTVLGLTGESFERFPIGKRIEEYLSEGLDVTTSGGLGKAWYSFYPKRINVMFGSSIFLIDGESIEGLTVIYGPPYDCAIAEGCYFDRGAFEAAVWSQTGPFQTLGLSCGGGDCIWQPGPAFAESAHAGVPGSGLDRVYLHTADGTDTLVWIGRADDDSEAKAVIATGAASEKTLMVGDPVHLGADPRPGGGLAAAVLDSGGALRLLITGDGPDVQTIDLGSIENGSQGIGVHAVTAANGEVVHVVLRETSTAAAHFTVKVADGTFTKETIEML